MKMTTSESEDTSISPAATASATTRSSKVPNAIPRYVHETPQPNTGTALRPVRRTTTASIAQNITSKNSYPTVTTKMDITVNEFTNSVRMTKPATMMGSDSR